MICSREWKIGFVCPPLLNFSIHTREMLRTVGCSVLGALDFQSLRYAWVLLLTEVCSFSPSQFARHTSRVPQTPEVMWEPSPLPSPRKKKRFCFWAILF